MSDTPQNWWSSFTNWLGGGGGHNRLNKDSTLNPLISDTTASGNLVDAETALRLSAVWACIRLRSQTIASLPLHLYDEDRNIAKDHPLYRVLHDSPNADMTASEFWEALVASLDLWGNAYALIDRRNDGSVIALHVLNPEKVSILRSKTGVISYIYKEKNSKTEYVENDILHIKGFTLDGLVGLSPIRYQAQVMGAQIDANRAANFEFKNQMKAGGFLKAGEKMLTEPQRDTLRARLSEFSQPENAGKYMVLEAGMDVVGASSIRMTPEDAQLLESRYFGIEEICRTFSTPPQLIYHSDKASSWASSLEGMKLGYLQFSLRPVLVRIEQSIVKKLLPPAERSKYKPKFSVEGLLRADTAGRTAFYTSALQNGWMSRNEVRSLEDLPPVDGADDLTVQLNLTPIDQLAAATATKGSTE